MVVEHRASNVPVCRVKRRYQQEMTLPRTLLKFREPSRRFSPLGMVRSSRCLALFVILMAQQASAQPPLQVQWTSELPNSQAVLAAFIDQNHGRTEVIYDEGWAGCTNEEYWLWYDVHGRPPNPFIEQIGGCIDAGVSLDHFVVAASRQGFPVIHVINASTLNGDFFISYEFGSIWGPGNSYASAQSVLVDGVDVYIGGSSAHCTDGWPVFKLGGDAQWPACVPLSPKALEATSDSILSINFPAVHTVDKATATVGSMFNLFSGTGNYDGKTCMNGDTLYWACKIGGTLHVGKYQLGYGNLWEQVLPFNAHPVELVYDEHGRLWTAAWNNLIWIDAATGTWSSDTIGAQIMGLDLHAGKLVLAGTMSTNLNFIVHGTTQP